MGLAVVGPTTGIGEIGQQPNRRTKSETTTGTVSKVTADYGSVDIGKGQGG